MSKGPDQQTTTQQRTVPDFLQPLTRQSADAASQGLSGLQNRLQGAGAEDLVAGFTPAQQRGQQQALGIAQGDGGVQAAQDTLRGISRGEFIDENIGLLTDPVQDITQDTGPRPGQGFTSQAGNILGQEAQQGFELDPTAQQALRSSASGDFLFGSPGFNEAVQASIREARPQILSSFATQGGSGAVGSGLAQAAQQQAASDAFAQLFGQERNRQIQAAQTLGDVGLQGRGQDIQAAQSLGDLGTNQQQVDIQGDQLRADTALGFGRQLGQERNRQLQAAQQVPQQALFGPNVMQDIGQQRQEQSQQEIQAPISAQQQLQQAGMSSLPINSLIGQQQQKPINRDRAGGALGGALAGAELGSAVPGLGTAVGAIGGGLLGGFF